jgi:hypothetical protein
MPRSNRVTQSSPVSLPSPLDYNAQLTALQGAFGNESPLGELKPLPQSSVFDEQVAKQKREASTTTGDYVESTIRQDSPIDGMVAAYVGSQYKPDPNYNPFDPKQLEEDSKGLPEEFKPELLKAVSAEHRLYIRSRLDDKVADMRRLGDLGFKGNAARFIAGLVEPTNLAIGLASGGVTSAARGLSLGGKIAVGLGGAGAGGYAFERARQKYNFEDSQPDAVWAGLMGMAFSAPFVGLHANEMYRLRSVASRELHGADIDPALTRQHEGAFVGDPVAAENGPVKADAWDAVEKEKLAQVNRAYAERELQQMLEPDAPPEKTRAAFLVDERENLSKADNAEVLKLATRALDTAPEGSMKDAFARALEKRTPSTVDTEELRGLLLKAAEEKHAAVQETALNTGAVHAEAPVQPALTGKQVDFHGGSGTVLKESPTKLFIEDHETGSKRWIAREDVLDAPEVDGFLAGSVGGAQVAHTPVERTAMTEIRIPFTKKTFNGRFDIFAQLNALHEPCRATPG